MFRTRRVQPQKRGLNTSVSDAGLLRTACHQTCRERRCIDGAMWLLPSFGTALSRDWADKVAKCLVAIFLTTIIPNGLPRHGLASRRNRSIIR
jgi:hypothetical protein